jgi:hypothetical protein
MPVFFLLPPFSIRPLSKYFPRRYRDRNRSLFAFIKAFKFGKARLISSKIDPVKFNDFTLSRRSHWDLFAGCDREIYGKKVSLDKCTLKFYQDLLVFKFIKDNIASKARILDVGGGDSRILKHFATTHDCWNIDKLEEMGNGPPHVEKFPYRMVLDYMGNFNSELPDSSFDFVFSISALEHTKQQVEI